MKAIAIAIALIALSVPALAGKAIFRVWGGELATYVPPEMYGKAMWSWANQSTALVHVVVNSTSSSEVDPASGTANVHGEDILLCYRTRAVVFSAGQPIPSAAYPQVLEFTITGLSNRNKYSVVVQRDCK